MHDSHTERMSGTETRAAVGCHWYSPSACSACSWSLPVLATYGQDLAGATPALIGLAIGAYGLTRRSCNSFGTISDRIGRRPVIVVGLLIFAAGAALAANADSIWGGDRRPRPAGRRGDLGGGDGTALRPHPRATPDQGDGDDRHEHRRLFAVAMVLGPVLTHLFGLHGLFWFTAGMALVGLLLILFFVPQPDHDPAPRIQRGAPGPAADPC